MQKTMEPVLPCKWVNGFPTERLPVLSNLEKMLTGSTLKRQSKFKEHQMLSSLCWLILAYPLIKNIWL